MSITVSAPTVPPSFQAMPPEHARPPAAGARGGRTVPPSPRWLGTGRAGGGGGRAGGGGANSDAAITSWVEAHFTTETIGGQTVYDLTSPK
jgi:hypothetical protein